MSELLEKVLNDASVRDSETIQTVAANANSEFVPWD
mgnify:CR=1 FL=1